MVFYCFGKLRLERCELVVQDQGICAILSDHGGADLPATNNLQGVGFHALDNGLCNRAGWLANETQIGTCSIRRHHRRIGSTGVDRQHMHALTIQLPTQCFPKMRDPGLDSGISRVEGYSHESNARGRSEEHTSELQSLKRNSYAVF